MTTRAWMVLELAAAGKTNPQIADEMGISTETVKSYVRRCLMELGARNRTHAVAIGIRQGAIR